MPDCPATGRRAFALPSLNFPIAAARLRTMPHCRSGNFALACWKGGTILLVPKHDGRQRAGWHGARVSLAAARQPPPRLLADPNVLAAMHLRPGRQLRLTKRDCRCCFDQPVMPASLRLYMARPRLLLGELLAAGATERELDVAAGASRGSDS